MSTNFVAALPRLLTKCACWASAAAIISMVPTAAVALPFQSWDGYHWARTGALAIKLGNNVDASWTPYFDNASTQWSTAKNITFISTNGTTTADYCDPVYGTVQVCSANYGATGWLGYATVYANGTEIMMGTVQLNDYYFSSGRYNTSAWRAMTACQEIGHTLGLAHNNTTRTDINKGSCMDYTNDPTGTLGTNGTLANIAPSSSDFSSLNDIYVTLDSHQMAETMPANMFASTRVSPTGIGIEALEAIPEPATWALMLAGFGFTGNAMRRRHVSLAA